MPRQKGIVRVFARTLIAIVQLFEIRVAVNAFRIVGRDSVEPFQGMQVVGKFIVRKIVNVLADARISHEYLLSSCQSTEVIMASSWHFRIAPGGLRLHA